MRLITKEDRAQAKQFCIPKGAIKIVPKGLALEFYLYQSSGDYPGEPCAMCFRGTAAKPTWRYRFKTEAAREDAIKRQIESDSTHSKYSAEQKAKRNQPSNLEIGHILRTCWGYDQTNVDFYQIVAKKGARTVIVRKLAQIDAGASSSMSGYVLPAQDQLIGPEITCRTTYGDGISVDGHHASVWEGKPAFTSSWH